MESGFAVNSTIILFEDFQSKFDLVLEGHAVLNHKIDRLAQDTHERFDMMEVKFSFLNQKIDAVKSDFSARIDQVETSLSAKIDAVGADLAAHRMDTETYRAPCSVSEPS